MTSMMLGTFTNGTGISSSPNGYVLAGKTGTTEAALALVYTSTTSGLLFLTPDVVIKVAGLVSDYGRKSYLSGSTSNGAAHIFRSMAETILPYTPEVLTVKNI